MKKLVLVIVLLVSSLSFGSEIISKDCRLSLDVDNSTDLSEEVVNSTIISKLQKKGYVITDGSTPLALKVSTETYVNNNGVWMHLEPCEVSAALTLETDDETIALSTKAIANKQLVFGKDKTPRCLRTLRRVIKALPNCKIVKE